MIIDESFSAFDALRREVMEARRGILILQKKELMDMVGKRRSGRRVNALIRDQLKRRGIVHFPKDMPMSQSDFVVLAMLGTIGQRRLERLLIATREDSKQASQQDRAPADESWPSIDGAGSVSARLPEQKQICSECGQEYSVEETLTACPGYWDRPYNFSQASARYCLACWLGVGPKDVAKMDAEYAEQSVAINSSPPTAQWLKSQMAEFGLTTRMFAEALGVSEKAVKHWEKNGLPIHGTGARMVEETLQRMFRERESRND